MHLVDGEDQTQKKDYVGRLEGVGCNISTAQCPGNQMWYEGIPRICRPLSLEEVNQHINANLITFEKQHLANH